MKSELAIMTKPKDPNVLVVYGVYVFRPADGGTSSFERSWHLRRAETPSELLLVTDLWDRSARHLLDDRKRRIKVAIPEPLHRIVAASLVGQRRSWVLRMTIAAGFGGAVYFARGCERTPGTARPQGAHALAIAGTLA
jgi:hypothetical protein